MFKLVQWICVRVNGGCCALSSDDSFPCALGLLLSGGAWPATWLMALLPLPARADMRRGGLDLKAQLCPLESESNGHFSWT